MQPNNLISVLFGVLLAFVALNAVLTLILNFSYSKGVWKQLFYYWVTVLGVFFLQSIPRNELEIILCASASIIPLIILARIPYRQLGQKFPWSLCVLSCAGALGLTFLLASAQAGFTLVALPFATALAVPLAVSSALLIKKWKEISVPQKFLLLPYTAFIAHNFNFAFFRMDETTQLWGWGVSFAIYQTLGVLLPAIVIEETKRTENQRLFTIVEERTSALKRAIKNLEQEVEINKELIKVVLHDISNPLTSLLGRLFLLKHQNMTLPKGESYLDNAIMAGDVIKSIIFDVRQQQARRLKEAFKSHKAEELERCLHKLKTLYTQKLEEKKIQLNIVSSLDPGSQFTGEDNELLANSVFSNIISNAIKFSFANSSINIHLYSEEDNIVVDFQDFGVGISKQAIQDLEAGVSPKSHTGTQGEKGTGFGLQLAKNYVEKLGGSFNFNPDGQVKGTLIRIKLKTPEAIAESAPESSLTSAAAAPSPMI